MKSAFKEKKTEKRQCAECGVCAHFDCICRFLYISGVQSIRILHRVKRKIFSCLCPIGFLFRHLYSISFGKWFRRFRKELTEFRSGFAGIRDRVKNVRSRGLISAWKEFFRLFCSNMAARKGFAFAVLNAAVPVICITALAVTANHWQSVDFGLILYNHGSKIASIQNEKVYEKATELVNQRMIHDTVQEDSEMKFAPVFQLTASNTVYQTADFVCNSLIKQSNGIIEDASGLYVDGKLQGAVKSSADLRYMLQEPLDKAKGKEKDATANFVKNVEIVNGLYPTTSILSTDEMRKWVNGTAETGTTYTVKAGDTVTSIATANHTTLAALKKINKGLGDAIKPGELIQLKVATPNLEGELIKMVTSTSIIPYTTVTQKDDSKYSDYSSVITQGVNGSQKCVDIVHTVNGVETGRENLSRTVLKKAVSKVVLTGTKKRPVNEKGVPSGKFIWPIPSLHDITTYFTWRWGVFHKGIDISGSGAYGSTIVAADGGVVELSSYGWNGGYGNYVIIDHQNGKRTLYAHCSSLIASTGEAVSKGQPIACVGSTGDSTGAHCHFEVICDGSNRDPLNYVSP